MVKEAGGAVKSYMKILRTLSLLTQLGISLVAPPLLLCWLALYLQDRFGLGLWVMPTAIAIGLLSAFCGVWRLLKSVLRQNDRDDDTPPVSFDRHM